MRERGMFIGGGEFHTELKRRVAAQLTPDLIRRGRWRASFKGLFVIAWALGSWTFLVFFADELSNCRIEKVLLDLHVQRERHVDLFGHLLAFGPFLRLAECGQQLLHLAVVGFEN